MTITMKMRNVAAVVFIVAVNVALSAHLVLVAVNSPFHSWQCDFYGQWALCAYTLHGIDPYPQIGVSPPLLPEVGTIPKDWGTSPWGLILGNLFYFGFLKLDQAQAFFYIVTGMSVLAVALWLFRKYWEVDRMVCGVWFAALSSVYILPPVWCANAGSVVCCLLLMAVFLCSARPYLAGVLLGCAMVKPQVALIFCFSFLFYRQWKVVATAALLDLAAYAAASFMADASMLDLMNQFLHAKIGGDYAWAGLFTILFSSDLAMAMLFSMTSALVFVFVLQRRFLESGGMNINSYLAFCPAAIGSSFCGYSFYNEFYVLLIPAVACFLVMMREESAKGYFIWLLAGLYCSVGMVTPLLETEMSSVIRTVCHVGMIILGIKLTFKLCNDAPGKYNPHREVMQ